MGDLADGWQTVMPSHYAGGRLSRAQVEEYERQTLWEWRSSKDDWSGLGKHISATEHPETKTRVHPRFKLVDDLGSTQISDVKKVHYAYHSKKPPICLARKRIKRRRGVTIEMLRAEAEVMERLDHEHIVKLVGTYSVLYNELYLLVWPVAVCDLSSFLDDIESLRSGKGDPDDIRSRFDALDLRVEDARNGSRGTSTRDHITLLRQIMGCIAQATVYCHSKHIRHLDFKPSNILLGPGRVYLADFGIAKDVKARDSTRTMGAMGTRKWQASEIECSRHGESEWSMKAADIYSLGLVLVNIAAVLYDADQSVLHDILEDADPDDRASGLERYQETLAQLALASQDVRQPGDHTVAPRHIIDLTSRMLSFNPADRPSAASVDKELVELGGLEQLYHSPCCKKSTRYLTELIDTRSKILVKRNQELQEENQRNVRRIRELEAKDETYQLRLENVEKKYAKGVANLERLLETERQQRKSLEAQLIELQRHGGRPRAGGTRNEKPSKPIPQLRYNAKPQGQFSSTAGRVPVCSGPQPPMAPRAPRSMIPEPPVPPPHTAAPQPQPEKHHARPTSFAGAAATGGVIAPERASTSPKPGLMSRRTNSNSKLPVAVTPTRSRTHTPNLTCDPSLTDSTQDSISSSTFSRLSIMTKESATTASSPAIGVTSPWLNRDSASVVKNGDVPASATGLGIDLDKMVQDSNDFVTGRRIASGPLSPVLSTSTMSSPRFAKSEPDYRHAPRSMAKVPSLPNHPSWAEVARPERRLQT